MTIERKFEANGLMAVVLSLTLLVVLAPWAAGHADELPADRGRQRRLALVRGDQVPDDARRSGANGPRQHPQHGRRRVVVHVEQLSHELDVARVRGELERREAPAVARRQRGNRVALLR